MLALATTQARVTGLAQARDAHGAPKAGPGAPAQPRGPYAAHRRAGATVLRDDGVEVRGCTWWLEPDAWPIKQGETITDVRDGTRWNVEGAQLTPAGLGLEQVTAACSQLQPQTT